MQADARRSADLWAWWIKAQSSGAPGKGTSGLSYQQGILIAVSASFRRHLDLQANETLVDVTKRLDSGATFVLVTDEGMQEDYPTWQHVIERNHNISMQIIDYIRHESMAPRDRAILGQNFAAIGDKIYSGKPLCNLYSPGLQSQLSKEPLLNNDTVIDQDRGPTGNTVTGLAEVQESSITREGEDNVDQPVLARNVIVEPATVQAINSTFKAEDEIESDATRVAVSEKAVAKKGDDFLDFLERALALYDKV